MGIIWVFRLLKPFQCFSLDVWFYSPLFIAAIVCLGIGIKQYLDDNEVGYIVLFSCSGFFTALFFYAVHWSKQYPTVPGKIGKVKIHPNDASNAPSAPKQLLLSETTCKKSTFFIDKAGRRCFLRGVNFSGITKVPTTPYGSTFNPDSLNDPANCSFVGRPCDLNEVDIHLIRLRSWGLTFLRLLITWEAVEHHGPGEYDEEYLEYLLQVVQRCEHFGISVFIDPHQDVWSRHTGGDGAPAWTLDKVGFDIEKLSESDAALTQQYKEKIGKGGEYGRMFWGSNYSRLANGTMWTIFFAGNHFTPNLKIDGESAQDYLRRHYCNAMKAVANKLKHCDNVLGFDTLNEPSSGYLKKKINNNNRNIIFLGWRMTVWQGIKLGLGIPQKVPFFSRFGEFKRYELLNPNKICVWKGGKENCVWYQEGLYEWKDEKPVLTAKAQKYFLNNPETGEAIDIMKDYAIPFFIEIGEAIREIIPSALVFAEPLSDFEDPFAPEKLEIPDENIGNGYVWAKHWYEPSSIIMQKFRKYLAIGTSRFVFNFRTNSKGLSRTNSKVLSKFKEEAQQNPMLLGETGIPFNMIPSPYKNNDFRQCSYALNTMLTAMDMELLHYTLWNYCPVNDNEHGDFWNKEDFSIFSLSQVEDETDLNSGGRSLDVIVRPYPLRVAGIPKHLSFDPYRKDKRFCFKFDVDPALETNESIFFLPLVQYHKKMVDVSINGGQYEIDWDKQQLTWNHDTSKTSHSITIRIKL